LELELQEITFGEITISNVTDKLISTNTPLIPNPEGADLPKVPEKNTNDKNINFGRINIEEISRNFNKNSYFYICGSNDFMSHFKSNLEKLGYENIVLDEWE